MIPSIVRVAAAAQSVEEERRDFIHEQLKREGGNPSQLLELLAGVVESEDWGRLRDERGHPLNFPGYIQRPYPVGLGWSLMELRKVLAFRHRYERGISRNPEIARRMADMRSKINRLIGDGDYVAAECEEVEPARTREEVKEECAEIGRASGQLGADFGSLGGRGKKKPDPVEDQEPPLLHSKKGGSFGGNRSAYLASRIKRDYPGIFARMEAGEFKSVRSAAVAAGIVQPTAVVPLDPIAAGRCLLRHFKGDRLSALIDVLRAALDSQEIPRDE